MKSKDYVLKILEEKKGESISGEQLGEALHMSRSAVWKAVSQLRSEGHEIDAVTNKGYQLKGESDLLSAQGIGVYLNNKAGVKDIHVYKTLESTNITAKILALQGSEHGGAVLAEAQSKGKGRLGRSFFSPKGDGLYMSIILRPKLTTQQSLLITVGASIAVSRAIEKVCQISPEIKWVNDLYVNKRKICGILTEAVSDFESGSIEAIILGIGINMVVEEDAVPTELKPIIGALFSKEEKKVTRNQLAGEIINEVLSICEEIEAGNDFLEEYRNKSMVLQKKITIIKQNREIEAFAMDINSQGHLIVRNTDGSISELSTGEISIRTIK